MSSFVTSITETVRYRGREGQWLWIGHRLAGLGTLLFLTVHILETSTVYFLPRLYPEAIHLYRSTPFMLGEILLLVAVLYHGINGLRIIVNDLAPHLWEKHTERQSFWRTATVTTLLSAPPVLAMGRNIYVYNICKTCAAPAASPLTAYAPWMMLGAMALVAVILFAGVPIAQAKTAPARAVAVPAKTIETWSWQFMRWSGVLLIPLVWFHVLLQDVLIGVHAIDLDYATLRLAMTGWKIYDVFLLAFAFGHGMNGLRAVVDDYVNEPGWNRAVKWVMLAGYLALTAIGAVGLFAIKG